MGGKKKNQPKNEPDASQSIPSNDSQSTEQTQDSNQRNLNSLLYLSPNSQIMTIDHSPLLVGSEEEKKQQQEEITTTTQV